MKRKKSAKQKPAKKFFVRFKNPRLLEAAFFHPSYRNETPLDFKHEDFDRLEFLGDSILNWVICRKIYQKFPLADEGILSRLRSILVSRKILSRIARQINLPQWLKLGKSLENQDDFLKSKMYADAFEALIAAIYFDQGFDKTEKFLLKCFRGYFDMRKLFQLDPNPKGTLQDLSQRNWQKLPTYASQPFEKGSRTLVFIHQRLKANAEGRNRQESEEKAARLLIRKLRQVLLGRLKRKSSGKKLRKTF